MPHDPHGLKGSTWDVESTIDFMYTDNLLIRVWRTEDWPDGDALPGQDNTDLLHVLTACQRQQLPIKQAVEEIAAVSRVSAVQAIARESEDAKHDRGFVIYLDWP